MATGLKDVKHFQAAISYEVGLVAELRNRRLAVKPSNKKLTNLDFVFLKRIRLHYRTGLEYFPTDYNFNMEYFSFLAGYKEHFKSFIIIHIRNLLTVSCESILWSFGGSFCVFLSASLTCRSYT